MENPSQAPEPVQQASVQARKRALWILLSATCAGLIPIGGYTYFEAEIHEYLERNVGYLVENSYLIFFGGLIFSLPLLVASSFLFAYGHRAAKAQRTPPPGYEVIRDTRILEGVRAVRQARVVQFLALTLGLTALSTPVFLWYVFHRLVIAS